MSWSVNLCERKKSSNLTCFPSFSTYQSFVHINLATMSCRLRFILCLLLLAATPIARAQNGTVSTEVPSMAPTIMAWGGCVDPNNPGNDAHVQIGSKTTICLMVGNDLDWAGTQTDYIRFTFQPKADEYSRFHVPDSYLDLVAQRGNNPQSVFYQSNLTITATSQTGVSLLRQYYDTANRRIYPFLTAIVDVDGGTVRSVSWDEVCPVFCSGSGSANCAENTYNFTGDPQTGFAASTGCWITQTQCDAEYATSTECDLTIYVVWTGTDKNGVAFQSAGNRFSQFPPQDNSTYAFPKSSPTPSGSSSSSSTTPAPTAPTGRRHLSVDSL